MLIPGMRVLIPIALGWFAISAQLDHTIALQQTAIGTTLPD
jgi:hypothetical protein